MRSRNDTRSEPEPAAHPYAATSEAAVLDVHRRVNDHVVASAEGPIADGTAELHVAIPPSRRSEAHRVVVEILTPDDVLHGAVALE